MLPLAKKQQKIHVTCLVKHKRRILLVRNSEFLDQASQYYTGYFGLPRFSVDFGQNPDQLIKEIFKKDFQQIIKNIDIIDIDEYQPSSTIQIIELIYQAEVSKIKSELPGKFFFATHKELSKFLFPNEIKKIKRLLKLK